METGKITTLNVSSTNTSQRNRSEPGMPTGNASKMKDKTETTCIPRGTSMFINTTPLHGLFEQKLRVYRHQRTGSRTVLGTDFWLKFTKDTVKVTARGNHDRRPNRGVQTYLLKLTHENENQIELRHRKNNYRKHSFPADITLPPVLKITSETTLFLRKALKPSTKRLFPQRVGRRIVERFGSPWDGVSFMIDVNQQERSGTITQNGSGSAT